MNNLFFINTRCQLKPPQFLYLFVLRLSWQNRPFLYTVIPRGNFGFTHMQRAFVCWNRTGSISSSSISVKVLPVQNDRASTLYSCPSRACLGLQRPFSQENQSRKTATVSFRTDRRQSHPPLHTAAGSQRVLPGARGVPAPRVAARARQRPL